MRALLFLFIHLFKTASVALPLDEDVSALQCMAEAHGGLVLKYSFIRTLQAPARPAEYEVSHSKVVGEQEPPALARVRA